MSNKTLVRVVIVVWLLAALAWFLVAVAIVSATEPALRVIVSPRLGLSPLQIRVDVRQNVEQLRGREVCVRVSGPMPMAMSCWQTDEPIALVTRYFRLDEPGMYQVWAGSGKIHSSYVTVEVPREKQRQP